ncbi:HNH endonuclease signature motif containing protein [Kribbella sp. VKM Ac-2568]|uniref:HNH endonuclease signature motif containing protein n=1 Tax=Kribbella sp. VKM Ac-2568 TaxID=2512219 RepID=UPI0010E0F1FC|nr:HNH endonuclease signature motif containing protein [Kribbella sp. VKM Ac-2568]TCM50035.1 uncharacterized protein DUF222 [Kribbella sp. VKM Ac-2568]
MEILGERPVWSMSDSEQLAALDALQAEISRLQTYRLQVLAAYDASGHAATLGAGDTARLLAFRHRLDPGVIKRDLALAKALRKYPAVTNALPATGVGDPADANDDEPASDPGGDPASDPGGEPGGEPGVEAGADAVVLSPAQAAAIVSELENVPKTVAVEDLAVAEQQLVALGRHFCPSELRKAARRVRDLLDADGPAPEEDKAHAREELRLRPADRGVKFSGYLANENAELFQSLILSGAKPRKTVTGELDPRSPDKRRADALTDVLNVASNAITTATAAGPADTADTADTAGASDSGSAPGTAELPTSPGEAPAAGRAAETGTAGRGTATSRAAAVAGYGPKAHVTVTIDLKDLTDAGAHAVGTLVHGEGLSAGAVRRLACEAQIIPIVLGANSEPLDVAMAQRFVNRAMRRALNARDKGCVVCKAPPIFCDAHHLISWIDNGPTALTNLVLLCRRHHIDTHHGHWTITLHHGGTVTVARPAWAEPNPTTTRTRYRTPTSSYSGAAASPGPVRNRTHDPACTGTGNTAVAQFDPWADPDPPDPSSSNHTPPPDDPPPGQRALQHAGNPPGAAVDGAVAQFDPWTDTEPPRLRQTHSSTEDPAPGHRALHHANNSVPTTTDDREGRTADERDLGRGHLDDRGVRLEVGGR